MSPMGRDLAAVFHLLDSLLKIQRQRDGMSHSSDVELFSYARRADKEPFLMSQGAKKSLPGERRHSQKVLAPPPGDNLLFGHFPNMRRVHKASVLAGN